MLEHNRAIPATTRLRAPTSETAAPDGYYMLFVLDDDRVPSEATIVQLRS